MQKKPFRPVSGIPVYLLLILSVLFLSHCVREFGSESFPEIRKHRFNILFLGSSMTGWGMMPHQTRDVALSLGDTLDMQFHAIGGGTMEMHTTNPRTLGMIAGTTWDYVVIETNPTLIAYPADQAARQIHPYALILDSLVHASSPEAEIVLYMPPAFKDGMPNRCVTDPGVCGCEEMQNRIAENILAVSDLLDAQVAPAGRVWQEVFAADSTIDLHDVDRRHANFTGAYVTACTIYATIWKRELTGCLVPELISEETAMIIHSAVIDVVLNSGFL